MSKATYNRVIWIFMIALFIFGSNGCKKATPPIQKQTRFLLDTYVTIQIPGDRETLPIIGRAMDRIEEINHKFNVLESGNALYNFNHHNVPIEDPEILDVIRTAMKIGQETGGAFDITIYPLIKQWGFFGDSPAVPDSAIIRELLKHVGLNHLVLTDKQLTKTDTLTEIDLGGIAKGYAVKEALEVINKAGIQSALIDAGGDIYALGELNGKPWKVGIRNPRGEGVIGVFDVSDLTVVTSGDYERFFEEKGIKYFHILNPKTGYPARGLASATVITDDAMIGDALSTAIFVMGKEKGLAFLEKNKMAEALFVMDNGQTFKTSGL